MHPIVILIDICRSTFRYWNYKTINSLSRPKYAHGFKVEAAQRRQWNLNLMTGNKAAMNLSSVNLHPVKENLFMMRLLGYIIIYHLGPCTTWPPEHRKCLRNSLHTTKPQYYIGPSVVHNTQGRTFHNMVRMISEVARIQPQSITGLLYRSMVPMAIL